MQVVSRVRNAVSELFVAPRNKAMIEQSHLLEHGAADEKTAGRSELLLFDISFYWKTGVVIVASRKRRNRRGGEFDATAHVVGATGFELASGAFEPVFGDGHIRVYEHENI